jgi:peptide deformylase
VKTLDCPCGTGKPYEECCKPFHQGKVPEHAVELMRSRFAAFALGLPEYIISTTHPASPQYGHDAAHWSQQIAKFCDETQFKKLEIFDVQEKEQIATVAFVAHLFQNEKDLSFTERSYFEKIKGRWLYLRGLLARGHAPQLLTPRPLRVLPLAYYGAPVLRRVADPVESITDQVRALVEEMVETMDSCGAMGLAAPQVHHSVRIFVFHKPIWVAEGKRELGEVKVCINPEVSLPSEETWKAPEGCLSFPTIRTEVWRPKTVTIAYTDLQEDRITKRVSEWEARVVQHENDHLNGILLLDHLKPTFR